MLRPHDQIEDVAYYTRAYPFCKSSSLKKFPSA
jgi:hypothetical protein